MKKKLILTLLNISISGLFPLSSLAQTPSVLDTIQKTGQLKVAIREDAVPFGYRNLNGNLSGICLDLISLLRQEIKQELKLNILAIELYKSTLVNRFDLVANKTVYLECGPNTIRDNVDANIQFSQPFFVTGTQLLIRQADLQNINLNRSLKNVTIGVLRNSTNQRLIAEKYPAAEIQEFLGTTGRVRGIEALAQGRIDAFASDGILLIGEAVLLGLQLGRDYLLIPPYPLECDRYGMIIPENDPRWEAIVNRTIERATAEKLFREWFGVVLPQLEDTLERCVN